MPLARDRMVDSLPACACFGQRGSAGCWCVRHRSIHYTTLLGTRDCACLQRIAKGLRAAGTSAQFTHITHALLVASDACSRLLLVRQCPQTRAQRAAPEGGGGHATAIPHATTPIFALQHSLAAYSCPQYALCRHGCIIASMHGATERKTKTLFVAEKKRQCTPCTYSPKLGTKTAAVTSAPRRAPTSKS